MAAIDNIYLTYEEYIQFREWLLQQPKLKDKYDNGSLHKR